MTAKDDQIQEEVEALKARAQDNRQLFRETAALLFFRHGIMPSTQKILQLVKRGSTTTINDELKRFWEDIRKKTELKLTHPELPEAVTRGFADSLASLWVLAQEQAQASLAAYRQEADRRASEAERQRDDAYMRAARSEKAAGEANERREAVEMDLGSKLSAEKEARRAAESSAEEWRREAEARAIDLERARGEYQADIAKHLEALNLAQVQYRDMEKRMLLDIDAARTRLVEVREAKEKADKQLDHLRETEVRLHQQIQELNARIATLTGDRAALEGRLGALSEAHARAEDRISALTTEAQGLRDEAAKAAGRFEAEIKHCRDQLEQAKSATAEALAERDAARQEVESLQAKLKKGAAEKE